MVTPMFISASQKQHLLSLFDTDIVYNSVKADRSFSLRAVFRIIQLRVSQMGGTFSPR